jgi:hypothetical protein
LLLSALWRQPQHQRIHGLRHIIEGALKASGRAGSHQIEDADVLFVGASAAIVAGTTFIFVREPYCGSRAGPQPARRQDFTRAAG